MTPKGAWPRSRVLLLKQWDRTYFLLGLSLVSCVYLGCCRFVLSVPQPSDWLERLVPEMTCCVSSGTLNSTIHSLTSQQLTKGSQICIVPDYEKLTSEVHRYGSRSFYTANTLYLLLSTCKALSCVKKSEAYEVAAHFVLNLKNQYKKQAVCIDQI